MATIYMDESGDLGFSLNAGSSRFFIVTFLFVEDYDNKKIRNIVKSTFVSVKKIHKRKVGVLHAYNESNATRRRLLNKLSRTNAKIMCIYLNKSNVYTHLQEEKNVLYNYITNILLDRIIRRNYIDISNLTMIVERKDTNKFLNENFTSYLNKQASKNYNNNLTISMKAPHEDKCLQATDFVSWSLFRNYEYNDLFYYNIFRDLVIEENGLFE